LTVLNFSVLKNCFGEDDGHQAATVGMVSKALILLC